MVACPVVVIMAGGLGSRLGYVDKGVLEVCGKPMALAVGETALRLAEAGCQVLAAVSRRNQGTLRILKGLGIDVVLTSGSGYVNDLELLLKLIRRRPILTMPIDTPLITPKLILEFVNKAIELGKPVVNLVGPWGMVGVSLFNGDGGEWGDVLVNDPRIMDVDDQYALSIANRLCS